MKKTALVSVALAAALAVVLYTVVWSQGGAPKGPPNPPKQGGMCGACAVVAVAPPAVEMLDRMADTLELTDDQLAQLKEVLTAYEQTVAPLRKTAAESCKALQDALSAAEYNADTVKGLATSAQAAEAAVIGASIDAWTQIRSILTADQAAKLKAMPPAPPPGGPNGPPPPGAPSGNTGASGARR